MKDCFGRLLEMASVIIHQWSQQFGDEEVKNVGIEQVFVEREENKDKWE